MVNGERAFDCLLGLPLTESVAYNNKWKSLHDERACGKRNESEKVKEEKEKKKGLGVPPDMCAPPLSFFFFVCLFLFFFYEGIFCFFSICLNLCFNVHFLVRILYNQKHIY